MRRHDGLSQQQRERRESPDGRGQRELRGYTVGTSSHARFSDHPGKLPIAAHTRRMQHFRSQKSHSLDVPYPSTRESSYDSFETDSDVTEQVRSYNNNKTARSMSPENSSLLNAVTSQKRRQMLLKQKSKSIDVPYVPQEVKEYCRQPERRSYDPSHKPEYSKDFDAQIKRALALKRGMTVDHANVAAPKPTVDKTMASRVHKMRTFKEQKSYSIDVPDKNTCSYEPEYSVRRERTLSQGQTQRPVVLFNTPAAQHQVPHMTSSREMLSQGHVEPKIRVLPPEVPNNSSGHSSEARNPHQQRLKAFSKQKSYSIDVPPSQQVRHNNNSDETPPSAAVGGSDSYGYGGGHAQRRDAFVHQKSYSVDVPCAEVGGGGVDARHDYKLPERKVESDSKIQVHSIEKPPTQKRLQFLRMLTEQGTFSFDDAGLNIDASFKAPADYSLTTR